MTARQYLAIQDLRTLLTNCKTSVTATHLLQDRRNSPLYYQEHGFRVLGNLESVHKLTEKNLASLTKLLLSDHSFNLFDADIGQPGNRRQFNLYEKGFQRRSKPPFNITFLKPIHEEIISRAPADLKQVRFYPSLLYSPGVNDYVQPPHHDLRKRQHSKHTFLMLIALMDDTSILLLHRSHRKT